MVKNFSNLLRSETLITGKKIWLLHMIFLKSSCSTTITCKQQWVFQALCETSLCHYEESKSLPWTSVNKDVEMISEHFELLQLI